MSSGRSPGHNPGRGSGRPPDAAPAFPPGWWGKRGRTLDIVLIISALSYLLWTGLIGTSAGAHSSADLVFDGRVWLLASSSLDITPEFDLIQWLILAATMSLVIYRQGPRLWWAAAIAGHVGAALISYSLIESAVLLGSKSAEVSAGQADFGVSIVLAASLGALTASGLTARRLENGGRARGDRFALVTGLVGLVGMAAFSIGWYDIQHLIGYAIGFFLARYLIRRDFWATGSSPVA